MRAGMAPAYAVQPIGPRFITINAGVTSRTRRSAARLSPLPPAMWISSSVPTTRSHSGNSACSCSLTAADAT